MSKQEFEEKQKTVHTLFKELRDAGATLYVIVGDCECTSTFKNFIKSFKTAFKIIWESFLYMFEVKTTVCGCNRFEFNKDVPIKFMFKYEEN